jgi:hypothetical protein
MSKRFTLALLAALLAMCAFSAAAQAETEGSGWEVNAHTVPTNLPPGGKGTIKVNVFNIGAGASHGTVTVTDTLPPGLTAIEAGEFDALGGDDSGDEPTIGHEKWDCNGDHGGPVAGATVVTCVNSPEGLPELAGGGGAPAENVGPNFEPIIGILVQAGGEQSAQANHVTVAGGEAPSPASTQDPITISKKTPPFGFVGWDAWLSNADGTLDTQAGSHPYEASFTFDLASALTRNQAGEVIGNHPAGGEIKNIEARLPPGLVGDPNAVPQCTRPELDKEKCPEESQIGIVTIYFAQLGEIGFRVFNMVPDAGSPAEFGFNFEGILTLLDSTVRSGGDYGITTNVDAVAQREIVGNVLTLWGVPGEASHDKWRKGTPGGCTPEQVGNPALEEGKCSPSPKPSLKPFLTLPTSCASAQTEPQTFAIHATTWQEPIAEASESFPMHNSNGNPVGYTGCQNLDFAPRISTAPETAQADTPTGLTVEVKPPVGGLEESGSLGTADIQNTNVTLPQGLVINPGQAAGLQACQTGEDGLTTEAEKEKGEENDGPPSCPNASKVGIVTIKSPLIEGAAEKQFEGNVYVLQSNPPELKLLVAASADGVNLKLVGTAHLNEQTGRLETTFEGTPQLPFTVFKLSFSGGAQAALDTPTQCGTYGTTADFTPWSSPFVEDLLTNASFTLREGPGGGACSSNPLPFSPSLTAGSTTDQAGGFTNFSLLLQRGDGQQRIAGLQFKAPAGLTGELSKVPLCTNAQAESNTCPAASKIGHTAVESGPGPYPLVVPEPGQEPAPIYLTESYGGAPFGLSIVVPLHVGPFVLPTQRVRAKIEIDPTTTQLTITTNELPQVVAGVPTDLREIDAVIERPEFMVNPTNCNPQSFSGTATGTPPPGAGGPGATAAISSPFGVGSCRSLEFAPKLSASTSGKTSKLDGASLTYKVTYPNVPQGTDADVQYVKVELPGELPSRLTTLQKACTAAQFKANPAGCPAASVIGHAVVHTQLLPAPLEGPVYFVSNGGEAFPNLVMVLQGDGVTVELVGDTLIKNGVTSTTFKTVPDDPFTTFEINLPEGPHSALAANGNLCKPTVAKTVKKKVKVKVKGHQETVTRKVKEQVATSLTIPSDYVGQNGATYNAKVPFTVTGCPKVKVAKKKSTKKAKGKKKK